jgi:ABC-type amino acid transport substrate-binding protein
VSVNGTDVSGLTLEMINAINEFQQHYQLEFTLLKPRQRYRAFTARRFDMIFFENKAWEWQGYPVDSSEVFLTGGEVYIARAQPGRGQDYFDSLGDKRLVGILGYHYNFADFNSDPEYLKSKFDIQLIDNNAGTIRIILSGRGDIAVVTKSYLQHFLKNTSRVRSQLLVSERMDQEYRHTILMRRGIRPGVDEINRLLADMRHAGELDKLWARYGIAP